MSPSGIVVVDTNVWKKANYLSSHVGRLFAHQVAMKKFELGLPEVIEREVLHHFDKDLRELTSKLREEHRRLFVLMGTAKELVVPEDIEIRERVRAFFERLNIPLRKISFDWPAAQSSFDRCVRGLPPSQPRNQQFKDGVLWANCISMADSAHVRLITEDSDFGEKRLLRQELSEEAKATRFGISLLHELKDCLDQIDPPLIDVPELAERAWRAWSAQIEPRISRAGVSRAEILGVPTTSWFATEDAAKPLVDFEVHFACRGETTMAQLRLRGEARFDLKTGQLDEPIQTGEELTWPNADRPSHQVVMGRGAAVLGHRTLVHTERVPLNSER